MIEGTEKYWFLFGLALVWIIFAAVHDLRKREVANWLNFSLVGFALAYRAFFGVSSNDLMFFVYGVLGFALFYAFANIFYYSRVFAGGDAKLLMGIGAVLPIETFLDLAYVGIGFLLLMFAVGAVYSLIYSVFLAAKNWTNFKREAGKNYKATKFWGWIIVFIFGASILYNIFARVRLIYSAYLAGFGVLMWLLFVCLKSLDKCMTKQVSPEKLTEGDWLERDVKVGNHWIKKNVHGLSLKDVEVLRKAGRKVLIKEGIPFVPAILISFLLMVFFLAVLRVQIFELAGMAA